MGWSAPLHEARLSKCEGSSRSQPAQRERYGAIDAAWRAREFNAKLQSVIHADLIPLLRQHRHHNNDDNDNKENAPTRSVGRAHPEQHAYATDRSPLAEFLKMFLIQKFGLPSIRDK